MTQTGETAAQYLRRTLGTPVSSPVLEFMLTEEARLEQENSGHEYDAGYHAAVLTMLDRIAIARGWEDQP